MFGFYTNVMPGGSGFQCGGGDGDARSHGGGQHHGHGHRHGAGRSEGGDPRQCGDARSGRCRPEFAAFASPSAGRCGPGGGRGPGGFGGAPGGPGDPGSFGPGGPRGRGARMFDPGALRLIVLQMIQESPRHGYEIIKVLEERIGGMYSPSPGVIYPILSMYEDMGYIASTPEGNKKLYAITDEGRGYLTQHAAYIAHLQAQMAAAGQGRDEGEVRQSMHALRAVLVERLRHGKLDAARLARIKEILQAAQDAIEKL